jgi:protein-disulfide isomerase
MKFLRAALFASTIFMLAASASAQTANPLADREDKIVPAVLLWSQQSGVKLTYLGNQGGIRGYLGESPSGNMQTMYVTPDGVHAVLGLLYDENFSKPGSNITGTQLSQMRDRYNRVADAVSNVTLDDKISLPEALSKIDVPRPEYDIPTLPSLDDNAPILVKLRAAGYQLTLLGEEGGVRGYFASFGKIKQPIYVTPDGNHFVMGYLIQRGGKNVSGVQIGEMRARFDAESGTNGGKQTVDTGSKIDATAPALPEPPVSSPSVSPVIAPETAPASVEPSISGLQLPPAPEPVKEAPVSGGDVPASSADHAALHGSTLPGTQPVNLPEARGPVEGANGNPSSRWYSNVDKAEFLKAMQTATYFDVGSQTASMTIYMVADPNCPYCHQTWDYLKSYVQSGTVRVRIVMIAFLNGSDEKAREIMISPRPGLRYLESDGGRNVRIESDTKSPEWQAMAGHLLNNINFAKRFGISATPFLAYTDADGQFYSSPGVPENGAFDAFFAAAHLTKK